MTHASLYLITCMYNEMNTGVRKPTEKMHEDVNTLVYHY